MAKYGTVKYGQSTYGSATVCGCCCRPIVNLTVIIKKLVLRVKPDEIER
jgi:hypothetical protein